MVETYMGIELTNNTIVVDYVPAPYYGFNDEEYMIQIAAIIEEYYPTANILFVEVQRENTKDSIHGVEDEETLEVIAWEIDNIDITEDVFYLRSSGR